MKLDISWRAIAALVVGTLIWRTDVVLAMMAPPEIVLSCPVAIEHAELKF